MAVQAHERATTVVGDTLRRLAGIVALAVIYVAGARLGLMLDAVAGFATLVWPPSGLALAALLVFGYRLWPGVAIGAFVANVWMGAPPWVALGIAAGNSLEPLLGAYALRKIEGFSNSLDRVRDVLGLIAIAALVSTTISATVGALSLLSGGIVSVPQLAETWRAWWVGDMMGVLVVAPVLLTWSTRPRQPRQPRRWVEVVGLGMSVGAAGAIVFSDITATFGQAYLFFPLLVWAALRFGQRGTTSTTFVISVITITGTALGNGPFVRPQLHLSLFALQLFMAVTASTFMILGASSSERRRAVEDLEVVQQGLENMVVERTAALTSMNTELHRRGAQLAEAQEITHIGSWEWDLATDVLRWTDEMYRICGLSPGELEPSLRDFLERVHPEDRAAVDEVVRQSVTDAKPFELDHRVVRPDGTVRVLHARGRVFTDKTAKPYRLAGTSQDVTEQRAAEEALQKAHDELERRVQQRTVELRKLTQERLLLAAIVDSSEDAILSKDLDGTIVSWNEGAERLYGYSAEEAIGRNVNIIAPADRQNETMDLVAEIRQGKHVAHHETIRRRKDGTGIHVSLSLSAIRDAAGNIIGASAIARDITGRKQAEEERSHLLLELEDAVRARDALISIASHELRTPLGALQLQVHLLMRTLSRASAEQYPELTLPKLGSIDRQVSRLARLIDNLLDVSRITAGRLQLELEEIDLSAVLREIVARFEEELRRARCDVVLNADAPVVGSWDRIRLEQIMTNLLSNAIKYGEGKPVEIATSADDAMGRVIVRDYGIGIAPKDQARIFERFERVVSGRQAGGFGLGLWIVRQIVEAMGGSIGVTSELGAGSTFVVELPRKGATRSASATKPRSIPAPGDTGEPMGAEAEQVLVVEDDPDILEAVSEALRTEGYTVACAANGMEAIEYLKTARPCIILLDLMMPVMDGRQFLVAKAQSSSLATIPVVLVSADDQLARKAEELKVAGFIQKPVDMDRLLSAIAPHCPRA